jgi:hypothetical protein
MRPLPEDHPTKLPSLIGFRGDRYDAATRGETSSAILGLVAAEADHLQPRGELIVASSCVQSITQASLKVLS